MATWLVMCALLLASVRLQAADCGATLGEAKAMAEAAAALLESEGADVALPQFMAADGPFMDRDLYVFVLDLNGIVWANGAFPDSVGSDAIMAQDSSGRHFVQKMIEIGRQKGRGWVEYDFFNPCVHNSSLKASFIIRVGDLIVGVGAYDTVSL